MDAKTLIIILAIGNIPIYFLLGKVLFTDKEGFFEAIKFWFKPDILSWFNGEYWDDRTAEFKLGMLLLGSVMVVVGEYQFITRFFLS